MSYTKGKWEIGTEPGGHFSILPDKSITVWRSPNAAANARLIAAAPDLLVACGKLTNIAEVVGHCVGKWTPEHQALAQKYAAEGRIAIAKAKRK